MYFWLFQIRFTQTTWQHVQQFREIVREQKHLDVEFIYLKLLHTHAFEFVHSLSQVSFFFSLIFKILPG